MRFWTLALTVLLSLTLLPPPLAASPAAAPDVWSSPATSSGDMMALGHTSHPTVANGAISIATTPWYLYNLQFPLDTNNTFLMTTGGGQAYALRYGGELAGAFHGNLAFEGFRAMDDGSAVSREATHDGAISVVTQVTAAPDNASAIGITYWVRNNGNESIPALKLYSFVEPNANSQNEETTTYDNGVIVSTNAQGAQALLGVAPCGESAGHAIGTWEVLDQIGKDQLNNASTYTGDSWLVQAQAADTLAPGAVASFRYVMRAATQGGSVADATSHCPAAIEQPPVDFLEITPPAAPTNLTATSGPGRVDLAWEDEVNPLHSTAYYVYRGDGSCEYAYPTGYVYGELSYQDHYATPGVEYCYFVTAVNTTYGMESTPSNLVFASAESGVDLTIEYLSVYPDHLLGDGEIYLSFGNIGPTDAWGVEVLVTVCPAGTIFGCEVLVQTFMSELGSHEWVASSYDWDTFGLVGEFTVCATITSHSEADADPSNDKLCEDVYFAGSGLGVGVDPRP